jgi:hypothetical protein
MLKIHSHFNSGKYPASLNSMLMVSVSYKVEALYSGTQVLKDRFYTYVDLYPCGIKFITCIKPVFENLSSAI